MNDMEFDKNKILTVVTADQARIGQKGWFSNHPNLLKSYMERQTPDTLKDLDMDMDSPFYDGYNYFNLFYPAPEPTYKERQTEWVVKNKVCIGTKVRVTRDFAPKEDGSNCIFGTENVGKKKIVGEIGRVTGIYYDCIIVEVPVGNWRCPFTVLEVIKEPSYRPFKNAEEFALYRDEWFRVKNGGGFDSVRYYDNNGVKDSTGNFVTYQELFEAGERENGEPCGVKEEV
jgi:hypothetical protein